MTARRASRLGFRGELLLLPLAALLLVLTVSAFTLFSYRNALELFADERRAEAARLAGAAAAAIGAGPPPAPGELHRLAPRAERVLLIDAAGRVAASWGESPEDGAGDPLEALGAGRDLAAPAGRGPGRGLPAGVVAGFAPLGPPAERRVLRLDLDAGPLAAQLAGLRVLLPVALAADAAVVILMLLFLRHLLTPFDVLLERARRLGGAGAAAGGGAAGAAAAAAATGGAEGDEIAFLVRTFERAVEALSAPPAEAAAGDAGRDEADIAALSRTLARSLESGVLLLDAAGAVLALNAVGADLLGVEIPAAGTPAAEALAAHPGLAGAIDAAVAGREGVQRREIELAAPGAGGPRTLGLTVHPLRRDDGAVRGFLALFADLTESRRRADADRLADRLARLGELAAGFAHELRNGLATLRGYLTLIERARGEERAADYLEEIRREADHLERVLSDFLEFARPGTARVEPVPAAALARRAAADPALGGVGVDVTVAPAAAGAALAGDPQLLERALRNLLLNAARAERDAGRRGPIELRVERVDSGVELAVADRGLGVPAAVRERLFHPFATGRPDGVGLGLALTHRIATLHGGSVTLEDRPGGGTRAVLALPSGPGNHVTEGNNPIA